jgi:hypothetical protein
MVVSAYARRAVVRGSSFERGGMECIDLGTRVRVEGKVQAGRVSG